MTSAVFFVGSASNHVTNVTLYGSRFKGVAVNAGLGVLFRDNITFDYSSFEPGVVAPPVPFNQSYQYGIAGNGSYNSSIGALTVTRSDLWGFGNAIDTGGSTQAKPHVFRDNWIHDAANDGGGNYHTDGIGNESGSGRDSYVVMDHNTIDSAGNTNGIAYQQGTYDNFTITNNLLGGFGYTVALWAPAPNTIFTGNTFSTRLSVAWGPLYPQSFWTSSGSVWKCNKWKVPAMAAWGNPADDGKFWTPNGPSATDYLGNTSCPGGTSDTTPPSTPTNLSASAISSSQINLSWSASTDNVGVTGYQIYRGGTLLTTVTGTSYSNTGLTASTAYSYTVKAVDAAGNVSANSNTASATTQAGTSVPTVTISANPTSITSGQSSTLTWSSTNATGCTASGGWTGTKATSGSQTLTNLTTTAAYRAISGVSA